MTTIAVAERVLPVRGQGWTSELKLRVFQPSLQKTGEYACQYEIRDGVRVCRRFVIYGHDSMQALLLGLGAAVVDVEHLLRVRGGRISAEEWRDLRRLRPRIPQS